MGAHSAKAGLVYNTTSILVLTGKTFLWLETIPISADLNLTSIALIALKGETVVTRTITIVGYT